MTKKAVSRKSPVSRSLWLLVMLAMLLTASAQWFIPVTPGTSVFPAYYCVVGLGASVVLILLSRLIGFVLKRPESYWFGLPKREDDA